MAEVAMAPATSVTATATAPATEVAYAPLVEETSLPAPPWHTPSIINASRTMSAHLGNDMQQGAWFMLLGCVLFVLVMVVIVAEEVTRLDKWLELLSAVIFCAGCVYLLEASYPANMMAMFAKLSAPPQPGRTLLEKYVTSSSMMLSTQLFNIGMLPYLVEGALNMFNPPADDPPGAALSLFIGVLVCMPLLLLFSAMSTEDAMRNNDGQGTSYSWERCVGPLVRALGGDASFWQCHVGNDSLFVFWTFFILMVLGTVPLVPLWLLDPSDSQHLCGVSMSCGASLLVSVPFTVGTGLMLRATYRENFGKESLIGTWLRAAGQGLLDCARRLEPEPMELTA